MQERTHSVFLLISIVALWTVNVRLRFPATKKLFNSVSRAKYQLVVWRG